MRIAIVGLGYLGAAYSKVFPEALIYDEPKGKFFYRDDSATDGIIEYAFDPLEARKEVNQCDIAIVAVPTDPLPNGFLSMEIIEEVVDWLETDLILIKSALMPGTVDRLVEKTGKKIAVSIEYIGLGGYYLDPSRYPDPIDPRKHNLIVVGGETATAEACASVLWSRMSPATRIHLVTAKEAEITKLAENAFGAMKVTWANSLYSLLMKEGQSYIRAHQAWSEDGRTDPMHTRVVPGKRGWKSHCWSKDIEALRAYAESIGVDDMAELYGTIIKLNEGHLALNE